MIEVDSLRRGFNFGHYDQGYVMGSRAPFHTPHGTAPVPDNNRVLIHWNQSQSPIQPNSVETEKSGSKSDEDEDDEDEDRPFTPPPPRERLSYTRYQLELLNGIYNEVRYPNSTQKQLIAKRVGITREQVKIWFQNRRRKDVVGNSGKSKSCDTSTSSTGSQDSDRQQSPRSDDGSTISDDSIANKAESPEPVKDNEETVVPSLVMKSIIGELLKFVNDPLKGRKNKKKAKAKRKEKAKIKKGLTTTLLAGSYDMISPPNQIVPHAFFEKIKSGFNHAKGSSAFANPRDVKPSPTERSNVSTTTGMPTTNAPLNDSVVKTNKNPVTNYSSTNMFPFATQQGPGPLLPTPATYQSHTGISGCEIPILSDLLAYRTPLHANRKKLPPSTSLPSHTTSSLTYHQSGSGSQPDKGYANVNSFNSSRPLNGIFPYPFLAEQPMFMSSLRQSDHILRPSAHYPPTHYSEDPYQPLLISSFSNPYFTSTPTSWTGPGIQNPPTTYAPL